jgi:putative restriction endonuclease
MRFYLGVTDNNWYRYLSRLQPEDVNFWRPSGKLGFKALSPGAPFLFKLKYPLNAVGGIGFFSSFTFLQLNMAWDVFGEKNGCDSFPELQKMILSNREDKSDLNPRIGCIVLTNPIFFNEEDWIETPSNWLAGIQQGKGYSTDEPIGKALWAKVENLLDKYLYMNAVEEDKSQLTLEESESPLYGQSVLRKVRLGQSAFRVLITDAYSRRCAITGEKTLPVLEAAHIKPYAESGPNFISNGLLLRSDMHKLFDAGYLTITDEHKVEVSKKLKEDFENGREYYQYHGKSLQNLPVRGFDKPSAKYIDWHNTNKFLS